MLQQAILRHPETFTNPNFRNCDFPATPPRRNQLLMPFIQPRYCLILATTASSSCPWPEKCPATRCSSRGSQANFSSAMEGTSKKSCSTPPGHGTIGQAQLSMLKRVRVHKQCITWPNLTLEKYIEIPGMLGKLGDHSYIS